MSGAGVWARMCAKIIRQQQLLGAAPGGPKVECAALGAPSEVGLMCNNFSFFFRPPYGAERSGGRHFALHELDLINSNVCLPCPKGSQPETATQTHTRCILFRFHSPPRSVSVRFREQQCQDPAIWSRLGATADLLLLQIAILHPRLPAFRPAT